MSGRHDWVQADVRCMLCGRVMGRLLGPLPPGGRTGPARPTAGRYDQFVAFRPADAEQPVARLTGTENFRCRSCGGGAILDDVETFTTYDEVVDEPAERPRRGRPPKPWRHTSVDPLAGLDLAG